jgi:transposase
MDIEILREAVKIGREKKLISRQPLPGLEDLD